MCGITARLLGSLSPYRFHIHMNGIVRKNESCGGVKSGVCAAQRLLFADDPVPLEFSQNDPREGLDWFSDAASCYSTNLETNSGFSLSPCYHMFFFSAFN